MIFDDVNLEDELSRQRNRSDVAVEAHLVDEVTEILKWSHEEEAKIYERLWGGNEKDIYFSEHGLDPERIYDLEDIRQICVKHRLRFLDTKHFKGEIPYEVILMIKEQQEKLGEEFKNFKIVAPSKLFKLEDCDKDPMLFLALGANKYYLIHKWGSDLKWYRKVLAYPMRNVGTLLTCIVAICGLIALGVPRDFIISDSVMVPTVDSIMSPDDIENVGPYRGLLFIYLFMTVSAFTALIMMQRHKNFSDSEWNNNLFKQ